MSGGQSVTPPAGWTELPDGNVVPIVDWNSRSQAGPTEIVCLPQSSRQPVFQGILNSDGTLTLFDSGGHELGVGAFSGNGKALQVTMTGGSVQTMDLTGTTLAVSAGGHSSAFIVEPDGHLHPTTVVGVAAQTAGGQPSSGQMVVTASGQTVPLKQWLQEGPMVTAPDGTPMHQNEFFYRYGDNPNNPWVMVPDGQMILLSDWLQEGPMVIAPDGTPMHENEFFYRYGNDTGDPWMAVPSSDGKGIQMMRRSQFAQTGPIVTTADGQQMHWGQFLLNNPEDPNDPNNPNPSNPWIPLKDPNTGQITPIRVQDYVSEWTTNISDMSSLAGAMNGHAADVYNALFTLRGALAEVEGAIGVDDLGRNFGSWFHGNESGFETVVTTLGDSLVDLSDGLYQAAQQAWATENANLQTMNQAFPNLKISAPDPFIAPRPHVQ